MSQRCLTCGKAEFSKDSPGYARRKYYTGRILNAGEIRLHSAQNHGLKALYAHARAKRVLSDPHKSLLKHLLDHHSEPVDHAHYVRVEREEWMDTEWYLLGIELGREPTEMDKVDHLLQRDSPSKYYRYYYYVRFPGMLKLKEGPHLPDKVETTPKS